MTDLAAAQELFAKNKYDYNENFRLRIHRSLSWLEKSCTLNKNSEADTSGDESDLDTQFIYQWIAFNAAYAQQIGFQNTGDKQGFRQFIQRLCSLDKNQAIYKTIWQSYAGSIRVLLDNPYIFPQFWDFHNGKISETVWQEDFQKAKQKVKTGLQNQDTEQILRILFNRFYTLRNQLFHGGSTYNSQVNRGQLRDTVNILSELLPAMLIIMQTHHDKDWGKPFYPVVE